MYVCQLSFVDLSTKLIYVNINPDVTTGARQMGRDGGGKWKKKPETGKQQETGVTKGNLTRKG